MSMIFPGTRAEAFLPAFVQPIEGYLNHIK